MDRLTHAELLAEISTVAVNDASMTQINALLVKIANSLQSNMYYDDVDGFTGGGDTDLDAIETTSKAVGTKIKVNIDGFVYNYELISATSSEYAAAEPVVIVPVDYAETTNEKIWKCTDNVIPVKVVLQEADITALKASKYQALAALGPGHYVYIAWAHALNIFGTTAYAGEADKVIYACYDGDSTKLVEWDEAFIELASGEIFETVAGLGKEAEKNTAIMLSYDGAGEISTGDGVMGFVLYIVVNWD